MTHAIEVIPWTVPTLVPVKLPDNPYVHIAPGVPLTEASAKTLAWLCEQFRRDVFAAAGKKDPQATP